MGQMNLDMNLDNVVQIEVKVMKNRLNLDKSLDKVVQIQLKRLDKMKLKD